MLMAALFRTLSRCAAHKASRKPLRPSWFPIKKSLDSLRIQTGHRRAVSTRVRHSLPPSALNTSGHRVLEIGKLGYFSKLCFQFAEGWDLKRGSK